MANLPGTKNTGGSRNTSQQSNFLFLLFSCSIPRSILYFFHFSVWVFHNSILHFAFDSFSFYFLRSFYYNLFLFNNSELVTTLTELKAIAPPAMIGLSSQPVKEYNTPAATGIPKIL